ncbi:hypothetical protein AgCh_002214 [Apium graveolens]
MRLGIFPTKAEEKKFLVDRPQHSHRLLFENAARGAVFVYKCSKALKESKSPNGFEDPIYVAFVVAVEEIEIENEPSSCCFVDDVVVVEVSSVVDAGLLFEHL